MSEIKPNVLKRSMYRTMEKSGDINRLKNSIREVLEGAGMRDRMKKWTDDCLTRQNPEVFNERSMKDKLVRVGMACIDTQILKAEVAKKFVAQKPDQVTRKRSRSRSTSEAPSYSKAYRYV